MIAPVPRKGLKRERGADDLPADAGSRLIPRLSLQL